MRGFPERLRARAAALGLSNVEVAKRAGLSDQRYANYVAGHREPDLATLVRLAEALETTPDWLLSIAERVRPEAERVLELRAREALKSISDADLGAVVVQLEALALRRE